MEDGSRRERIGEEDQSRERNQRQTEVGEGAREGRQRHAAFRVAEGGGIHGHGLRPPEADDEEHERAERIDVRDRIERKSPGVLRRGVAETMRGDCVRPFVDRDRDEDADDVGWV